MKKIFNLILIAIIWATVQAVEARVLSTNEIKSGIRKATIEHSKKYTDAQLEVKVLSIPFQTLEVPEGKVTYVAKSNSDRFLARDVKKISVYVNNNLVKNFVAPVQISAYKDVLVAKTRINAGSSINSSNTYTKKMDIANFSEYYMTEDMIKKVSAKKFFNENELIDKRFVIARPDVRKNSTVYAYFNSNRVMIAIDAIALTDGMLGDYVSLESKNYKKRYMGKVVGENKVLIEI